MKKTVRILSFPFMLACLIPVIYIFYLFAGINHSSKIPVEINCRNIELEFDFESKLRRLDLNFMKKLIIKMELYTVSFMIIGWDLYQVN